MSCGNGEGGRFYRFFCIKIKMKLYKSFIRDLYCMSYLESDRTETEANLFDL